MMDRWIVRLVGIALPFAMVTGGVLVLVVVRVAETSV
jgi:hypothetical protein